jgi:hypothetical protein
MLGFVLSCHKMDDNYGQHTCDSPASTGSPCVKQKIYNTQAAQSFGNGYNHKAIVFFTCSFTLPQTYLRTTMKGTCINGQNRKWCLEKQLRMRTSTSSPSWSDAMTSTRKWVTCAGTGFLVTSSTSALNFIGNRSSFCAKDKESQ